MRRRLIGLLGVVLCLWGASSCGSGSGSLPEWPTPVPQMYTLVQATGWEDLEIRTVCLSVEETYDFGDLRWWSEPIPEEGYVRQAIEESTRGFLDVLGVEVVAAGSACDASLFLDPVFTPLGAVYSNATGFQSGTCYTGAKLDLGASLQAPGRPTLACDAAKRKEPPSWTERCPNPATAPYDTLWEEPLSVSMLCTFGSSAYCPLLVQVYKFGIPANVGAVSAFDAGQAVVALPCLVELLRHSDRSIRFRSIGALSWLGPRAKAAVPYLLQIYLDEADPHGLETGARLALERITGVGLKPDAHDPPWADDRWSTTEWLDWWNDQDPDEWGF